MRSSLYGGTVLLVYCRWASKVSPWTRARPEFRCVRHILENADFACEVCACACACRRFLFPSSTDIKVKASPAVEIEWDPWWRQSEVERSKIETFQENRRKSKRE